MNEDMILPEDFQETDLSQSEEIDTEVEESTEQTSEVEDQQIDNQTKETETQTTEQPKIKIKYNHEEKEVSLEEAQQLAQKGMNYDKLQEKINSLQNDPGLLYLNELAKRNNTSVSEMVDYWRKQEEQAELNELIQKNIPEEYAREMIENRKFRQQLQEKEKSQVESEKQKIQIKEFQESFPNVKAEDIPEEVLEKSMQGVPLKYAYMEYERKQLSDRIKILEQNSTNKKKALVTSVTSHGSHEVAEEDDFLKGFNSI